MNSTAKRVATATALALLLSGQMASAQPMVGDSPMNGMKMAEATNGTMIMLKGETVDGIKAMPHLKDIAAAMAKHGSPMTHHLMVNFTDARTGAVVGAGRAAVKVTGPTGETSKAVMMMPMEGGFGADLELPAPGNYVFEVGTKLDDGRKRLFTFQFTRKGNG